jgi:bacteriocin biosynthesis cyclodehydratase domain-containing protein
LNPPSPVPLRLPTHYRVWLSTSTSHYEETLIFSSGRRTIAVEGKKLSAFYRYVLPLLDGTNTLEELKMRGCGELSQAEIEHFIELLAHHNLLDLEGFDKDADERLSSAPIWQLNYFHEIGLSPKNAQLSLSDATVAVFGLSGAGAYAALALAASGIGHVRCIDDGLVDDADLYFAPIFTTSDLGSDRALAVGQRIDCLGADVAILRSEEILSNDHICAEAMSGLDFVICGAGHESLRLLDQVNEACLDHNIPWTSCFLGGIESIFGPTVFPGKTACYKCYQLRLRACSPEPESRLEVDGPNQNNCDGLRMENLTFGEGILGNLSALEAFKVITGAGDYFAAGEILVIDIYAGRWEKHSVLRKPWCPSCLYGNPVKVQ